MDWTKHYQKAVTFSYDDGVFQDKRFVEILNRYGLKGTFNINTSLGNNQGSFLIGDLPIQRYEMRSLKTLYTGHEIASHTSHHFDLTTKSNEEIMKEIKDDIKMIEMVFNAKPVGFAYPFGKYNEEIKSLLKSLGIKYARTVEPSYSFDIQSDLLEFKPTVHHKDPKVFDLIETFLNTESNQPQIFYLWGHSYEFDVDNHWELIDEICRRLANHQEIFYGTNKEVFGL